MIRFFDILFSTAGLIILSPLFLILWLLIKLGSKGPGFFIQERIGKDRKPFKMLRFRSMRINDESDSAWTRPGDPRRTGG